jgi:hypothetical protein
VAHETSQRFGQQDRLVAQPDVYLLAVGVDVVEGQSADVRGRLGVEQDQQGGDAVFGFDGVVVQQPASLFPPGFGVDDAGGSAPPDWTFLGRARRVGSALTRQARLP